MERNKKWYSEYKRNVEILHYGQNESHNKQQAEVPVEDISMLNRKRNITNMDSSWTKRLRITALKYKRKYYTKKHNYPTQTRKRSAMRQVTAEK